jgi:hypothetical protein
MNIIINIRGKRTFSSSGWHRPTNKTSKKNPKQSRLVNVIDSRIIPKYAISSEALGFPEAAYLDKDGDG